MSEFERLFNPHTALPGLTDQEIVRMVDVLSNAERNHREWLRRLNRGLICAEPFDSDIVAEGSHLLCRFGRWYYDEATPLVRRQPDFEAIEAMHKRMHDHARRLSSIATRGERVCSEEYEEFADEQTVFFETLHRLRDRLRDCLVDFDGLTGARTRQAFGHILQAEAERVRRTGDPCCIALIDLDHFKSINDRLGHLAGDRVLREVAQEIRRHMRAYDAICRFGGEEFLLCLPNTALEAACNMLERLRLSVASLEIDTGGESVGVTVSVGVAQLDDGDADIERAFTNADAALYAAKNAGRNQLRKG